MYGYASELLPLLQGLLGDNAQAPNVDMSGAMPSAPNTKSAAPTPPRRPQNMSSSRSAPMPPRRPEGLLGSVSLAPQAPQISQPEAIAAFLASQGIGQPQGQMPPVGMPRIDSGPAAGPAQGPGPMQAAMQPPINPPLPPHRPQMGPPMPMGLQGLALPRGATTLSQGPGPVMQSNTPEDPRLAWLRSQLYGG